MDRAVLEALLETFDGSDWLEMTVTIGDDRLHVSRRRGHEQPGQFANATHQGEIAPPDDLSEEPLDDSPVHAEPVHVTPLPVTGILVESPSVGLFWRSPAPGAPPFVEVGTRVARDDTLAIVEVMKLMSHLIAPVAGVVKAILAENGAQIDYGQPLVAIDPDE